MFISGFADEAGADLATQIRAHKELGWSHIDLRNIDGCQFTDVSDEVFDSIYADLEDAGLTVSCFEGGIANWATKISEPLSASITTLERCIPRMNKMGTKYIRGMTWPNDGLDDDAWRDEVVRRYKELAKIAENGGIVIAVENCDGWASQSAENYGKFFELVDSPAICAAYDTGNPPSHGATNTWDWYTRVKPFIDYVHIKSHTGPVDGGEGEHTYPGEGISLELETLTDLFKSGYDGGIVIEPHLSAVVHEDKTITNEEVAYRTYIEYGRRTEKVIEEALAIANG